MNKEDVTQELVREWFDYDPIIGTLVWRKQRKGAYAGKVAGHVGPAGYLRCIFFKKHWLVHRLIWLHVHGRLPDAEIDHINGVRDDNRLCNLREVSRGANQRNTAKHRAGRLVGAYYRPHKQKWLASLWFEKKQVPLGLFDTELEAHMAWRKAREERGMLNTP